MIGCFGKTTKKDLLYNSFQYEDSILYIVGSQHSDLGGSLFCNVMEVKNTKIGKIDVSKYSETLNALLKANAQSLLESCSYSGLGGLAAAVSKMCFKNSIGCSIKPVKEELLFSENLSFVVEIKKENTVSFQRVLESEDIPFDKVGSTNNTNKIIFDNYINTELCSMKNIWKNSLRERLQ
jgi:phosphoribosylformylglycinamidine (FGAM) synthase-like enzyme